MIFFHKLLGSYNNLRDSMMKIRIELLIVRTTGNHQRVSAHQFLRLPRSSHCRKNNSQHLLPSQISKKNHEIRQLQVMAENPNNTKFIKIKVLL